MLIAFGLTAYVIAGLILYTAISKHRYSTFKAYLFMVFSSTVLIAIIFMFKDLDDYFRMVWCSIMVVVIGFYLIYDTYLIIKGKTHQLTEEDYIIGALFMYIDVITLFIYLLKLLIDLLYKGCLQLG